MSNDFDSESVRALARLARLDLREAEAARLADDLAAVLRYVDRLALHDTRRVAPWRPTDPWPPARPPDALPPPSVDAAPPDWREDVPSPSAGLSPRALAATGGVHFDPEAGLFDAPLTRE